MKRSTVGWTLFLMACLLEGSASLFFLLVIPTDEKNASLAGFSLSRWGLVASHLFLLGLALFSLLQSAARKELVMHSLIAGRWSRLVKLIGAVCLVLLWATLWFPDHRFGPYIWPRIKGLVLWIELAGAQLYILIKISRRELQPTLLFQSFRTNRFFLLCQSVILSAFGFGWLFLGNNLPQALSGQFAFNPPPPVTPFQVLGAWVILAFLLSVEPKLSLLTQRAAYWSIFLAAAAAAFFAWQSVPLTCQDDMIGPTWPNYVCYPQVDDAVYSVGSHYITLGQGIYNQWQTDKPVYMTFLAICQLLAGERIDRYLAVQAAVLAILPAALFILGRRLFGLPRGMVLALLAILKGAADIATYQATGSPNVKLENTEYLTALFLTGLALACTRWWNRSSQPAWAAAAGGILGLASLIRLNPLFILPFILAAAVFRPSIGRKSRLLEAGLFCAGFGAAFLPWMLLAQDANGNNFLWLKINEVLQSRYLTGESADWLAKNAVVITVTDHHPAVHVLLHFLNNLFMLPLVLPVHIQLLDMNDVLNHSFWSAGAPRAVWAAGITLENAFMILVHSAVILTGVWKTGIRHGLRGLAPLFILVGYLSGNAAASTSGSRYLTPVAWVTLLYFVAGMVEITRLGLNAAGMGRPPKTISAIPILPCGSSTPEPAGRLTRQAVGGVVLAGLLGLALPALPLLPDRLPPETSGETRAVAREGVARSHPDRLGELDRLLAQPGTLVVAGRAYHPLYYANDMAGTERSLELMTLAKEHVFVSYLGGVAPEMLSYFSDGSEVVVVGCQTGADRLWSSHRIILTARAVIQRDNEGMVYVDGRQNWSCPDR